MIYSRNISCRCFSTNTAIKVGVFLLKSTMGDDTPRMVLVAIRFSYTHEELTCCSDEHRVAEMLPLVDVPFVLRGLIVW